MSYFKEQVEEILWDKALGESVEDMRIKANELKEIIDDVVENIEIDIKDEDYHPMYVER